MIESLDKMFLVAIITFALVVGSLLIASLLWAGGIKIPIALHSMKDKERHRISVSYAVFLILMGLGYIERYLEMSQTPPPFVLLHFLTAISGIEVVSISLYYRIKILVCIYH